VVALGILAIWFCLMADANASQQSDRALERARHHARVHARCLGVKVPKWVKRTTDRQRLVRYVHRTWKLIRFPRGLSPYRWLPLARHVGWPERAIPMLRRVILRESSGNPRCITGVHHGLMQIRRDHSPSVNLLNPAANLVIGLRMWRRLGWVPWAATAW